MICRECGQDIVGGKGDYWHTFPGVYGTMILDGHPAYPKEETMSDNGKEADDKGPNDKGPDSPISALLEAAISMHEMYVSFIAAGFTETQAMTLVAQTLRPQSNG